MELHSLPESSRDQAQGSSHPSVYTLVLDLDETLIHFEVDEEPESSD
jgi:predicted HAD superfamily phosphohydrolase YqeG